MLSIVIPAFNEEHYIGSCLESLVRMHIRDAYEIIVVDNNSTDRTCAVVKAFCDRLPLRIVAEQRKGRGAARARGFSEARGDIIFSADADCILPLDWITALAMPIQRGKVVGSTGPLRIGERRTLGTRLATIGFLVTAYMFRVTTGHWILSGFSAAISADIYRKSGGFNADMDASEDIDLSKRISRFGKISLVRSCIVTASERRFKNGVLGPWLEYARCVIATELFRKKRSVLSDVR